MLLIPYVRGFLIGVFLAILALYVQDHVNPGRETLAGEPQKIANSDVAAQKTGFLTRHDQRETRGDTFN
jgi:hypothetical protein